ncbi:hypothetical protein BJF93_04315 [Xaviernesmea oryzae]|uniref:VTT domain-containing protein n=1 Tax=Xaviernesmea oryzae TaxID=464029 RepID=A0A1Q9AUN2_9HYPH|nr:YqaA family protein [Xaviernesmea oryzae]OLP59143.1 hypothetical protein BJF93_04315 [Xaviernesmea oryzae]SEK84744.1 membrane protein YqaA, SNARE-associated domain [Xaviernesmea oryzae]
MILAVLGGVFIAAFLSATLLPGASEAAFLAAVTQKAAPPASLFMAATLGNVLGSLANLVLGRFFLRYEDRRWFPVSPAARARAERLFHRFGHPVLFFAWLPVVGDPLTLVAGLLRMPLLPFLVYVTLGKAARYGALLWLAS